MAFVSPFQPQGNTLIVASTAASATAAVQVSTGGAMQGVRLVNLSTNDVYVAVASSSSILASLPTTATPSTGTAMPLLQRSERVLTVAPNFWLSAITSAGQANLSITAGFGS